MQRDILLLTEMIDAAEQAHQLTAGITIGQLDTDRQRRDAMCGISPCSARLPDSSPLKSRTGSPAYLRSNRSG
jgi:hypothetical protein